jgi:hypothetical protein
VQPNVVVLDAVADARHHVDAPVSLVEVVAGLTGGELSDGEHIW